MTGFDHNPQLRWLFCMTHPDDEISICAWMRRLVRQGNPVYVSWTHSIPVREQEARDVARMIGIPQEHLLFHGATDGSVCDEMGALRPTFQAMMDQVKPDRVACGAFEQGHLDHDATNWLVHQTFPGPVLEIPFYHTYLTRLQRLNRFSDPRGQHILPLEPDEQRFKKAIARQYPSQNIWRVLLGYEAWQTVQLRKIELAKTERMRYQTHSDFLNPNHPERLADAVRKSASWRRWEAAVRRAEAGTL